MRLNIRPSKTNFSTHPRFREKDSVKKMMDVVRTRLLVVGTAFVMCFSVIGARLIDVTILRESTEQRVGDHVQLGKPEVSRSNIVDRNGEILATSLATQSLYANPKVIIDAQEAAQKLHPFIPELTHPELLAKLSSGRGFIWLKRNLTPKVQDAVHRLGIPGIYFQREEKRVYPHGSLISHVLGYTDVDGRGIAGVEQYFDTHLSKTNTPLELSLDVRVQHVIWDELNKGIKEFNALGGMGVVLDVKTGEVLSMVSLPDFDPNQPNATPPEAKFNATTLGIYEMGSTFKTFTTAMALESKTVTLETRYDATTPIRVGRHQIKDFKGKNSWLNVSEIFLHSSNIGSAKIALDVGAEKQREFLKNLGLLTTTSLELPEVGIPLIPSRWREVNTMTISYGYGVSVSPLQLASAVSSIINGGFRVPSTLLKTLKDLDEFQAGERVVSLETSKKMRTLMRMVVVEGTGRKADVQGYDVIGKTGTAEKTHKGRYKRNNARISSFVGAFPMASPRYLILIMLDEPQPSKATAGYATGGWVAAPISARVISRIAPLLGVTPRLDVPTETPSVDSSMVRTVKLSGARHVSY